MLPSATTHNTKGFTMPTLWIHMGMPEADSSSLQGFLTQNGELLRERNNIYIPRSINRQDSACGTDHDRQDGAFLGTDTKALDQFIAELKTAPGCDCIVSDEQLVGNPDALNPAHLAAIGKAFPDLCIKTVTYMCRGDDSLKSAYARKVEDLIRQTGEPGNSKEDIPDYDYNGYLNFLLQQKRSAFGASQCIARSQELLDVENTVLRLFGKDFLVNGDIVDDFFSLLGVDTAKGFTRPKGGAHPGLPAATVPFFMPGSLPGDMPTESREALGKLANDTFTRINTVTHPRIAKNLREEMAKVDEIYSRYTSTLGDKKPEYTYMDIYSGKPFDFNSPSLECDKHTLYLIRQLNYVYSEVALLQAEVKDLRQTSILALLRTALGKCMPFLAPLYAQGRDKAKELIARRRG